MMIRVLRWLCGYLLTPWWAHWVLLAYTVALAAMCITRIRCPRPGRVVVVLPHLATAPLLLATALSFTSVLGDASGAGWAWGTNVRIGFSAGMAHASYLLPAGIISYLVLLPLSLVATIRSQAILPGKEPT